MSPNIKGSIFALLGFAFFSAHDVIVKYLGGNYSTFQIIFFSVLVSFPFVFLVHLRELNHDNLLPKHPWWSALRTVTTVLSAWGAFYAFSVLPLAQTYAFLFVVPLIITVLSIPILGEKVGIHRATAVFIGLIGVLIVLRPGLVVLSLGHVAALCAALCGGISSLIVRKIGNEERTIVLLIYPMFANLVLMGAFLPFYYVPLELVDLGALTFMAVLALVASTFLILVYKTGDATTVAPMQYSQMIWAIFYGAFLFGELPDRMTILGSCVIIISGLYVVYRETLSLRSQNTPVLRNRSRTDTGIFPRISFSLKKRDS